MADPIGYSVSYSFSGWQANNPSLPLPAGSVDNEFSNVSASIATLVDAVVSIRRSDGMLKNGLVGPDQLSPDLLARMDNIQSVTFIDISPTAIATQVEAEAGVANDKLMTPLRVVNTIDAKRQFASQGEAQAGVSADKVMSPLRTADALSALRPFASQAEAEAGSVTDKTMSPLRVKEYVDTRIPAGVDAPAIPTGSAGVGNYGGANIGENVAAVLPAGGMWAYVVLHRSFSTGVFFGISASGVAAGGTTVAAAPGVDREYAFIRWRVA